MPVSDKMVHEYNEAWEEEEGGVFEHRTPEDATQAVVNAAWNKFDPEDESTWPYPLDTLLGAFFWCEDEDGDIDYMEYDIYQWKRYKTIRYADPQDLKFEEDE